jgi:hypothetical protein
MLGHSSTPRSETGSRLGRQLFVAAIASAGLYSALEPHLRQT